MKRTIKTLVAAGVVGSTAVLAGAYFGVVNVGADDPHFPAVHAFLTMARDRSIEVRSRDIEVPNLMIKLLFAPVRATTTPCVSAVIWRQVWRRPS